MQRNLSIDIAKGIGILLVILGHQGDLPMNLCRRIIYSFHMPLFFLIAGYFFNKIEVLTGIKKDLKRLILPYCATGIILLLWTLGLNIHNFDLSSILKEMTAICYGSCGNHSSRYLAKIPSIGPIWFLLALFWCKNAFNLIFNTCKSQINIVLLVLGISVSATLADKYLINLPFAILPGLSATMFYLIGYLFSIYKSRIYKNRYGVLFIGFVCSIIAVTCSHLQMVQCSYGMYPVDVAAGCFGTYITYLLSKVIAKTRLKTLFVWLGVNSLTILCLHTFELNTGIWWHLHIDLPMPYMIAIKIAGILIGTALLYYIPVTRNIFKIKNYGKYQ